MPVVDPVVIGAGMYLATMTWSTFFMASSGSRYQISLRPRNSKAEVTANGQCWPSGLTDMMA